MAEERSLLSPTASPAIGDISEDNSFLEDWSRARDKTRLRSIIESLHRQATRYWVVLSLAVGAIVLIGVSFVAGMVILSCDRLSSHRKLCRI